MTEDDINALVLREPEEEVVRRGRKWVLPGRVWLPGFILVQCVPSPAAFRGLLGSEYVTGIVGGWEKPYRVSEASINKFNEVMSERDDVRELKRKEQEEANKTIQTGNRVRITLGPFANLDAIVVERLKGKEKRCKLRCNFFGGTSEVTIPLANLQKL